MGGEESVPEQQPLIKESTQKQSEPQQPQQTEQVANGPMSEKHDQPPLDALTPSKANGALPTSPQEQKQAVSATDVEDENNVNTRHEPAAKETVDADVHTERSAIVSQTSPPPEAAADSKSKASTSSSTPSKASAPPKTSSPSKAAATVVSSSRPTESVPAHYEPEKVPMDVRQEIEKLFHTSYPIHITKDVFDTKADLIKLRRYFHANPELSWQEVQTAKNIASYCESLGLATKKNVGRTGVVAVLHGAHSDGECIALRADMDALPIQEENPHIKYQSRKANVSHACGHDCHMAILLTVARILSGPKYVRQLHGCVKLIFQPAEEGGGGAKFMIDDGVLDADDSQLNCPAVDQVYGLHVWSYLKLGKIVAKSGALMAGSAHFEIRVRGVGGHGAEPKGTSDTVLAITQLCIQLHSIVSRNLSATDCGVVTVGTMRVGAAPNVIAEDGSVTGTIRFLNTAVFELIQQRIQSICRGIELSFGVTVNVEYRSIPYPPTVNHAKNVQYVTDAVHKVFPANENVVVSNLTTMAAEDFSFYLNERPGCYFFVGCGVDEYEGDDAKNMDDGDDKKVKIYAHHTPTFRVDERCLLIGVQIMVNLVMELLSKPKQVNNTAQNEDATDMIQINDFKPNEQIEDKMIGNDS